MESTGVVKSMKDFYWDIRPKPEYGTIELRVCDTPLSLATAAALAGYLQALCQYISQNREEKPSENDYLVYTYNRFQACRFGLDGIIVDPKTNQQISIKDDITATMRKIEPNMNSLHSLACTDRLYAILDQGGDASQLRREYDRSRALQHVVQRMLRLFRER